MKSRPLMTLPWLALFAAHQAGALGLEDYLKLVREKNGIYQSTDLSKEASDARREQGDLVLSPYLNLKASYLNDQTPPSMPAVMASQTKATQYSLGVAKRFSTGTSLGVDYVLGHTIQDMPASEIDAWTGGMRVTFAQSLWRDGFGSATRLRREREDLTAKLEKLSKEVEARQTLVAAESTFWDALYQQEELRTRGASIKRADRLVEWTKRRLGNGIGDRSDLLQVEALQGSRRLQLAGAEDASVAGQRSLSDFIQSESIPALNAGLEAELAKPRSLDALAGSGAPVRADVLLKSIEAKLRGAVAEETTEGLRPDLSLTGAYTQNSRETGAAKAFSESYGTEYPTVIGALQFSMDLDRGAVDRVRAGAKAEARAAEVRAAQADFESKSAWSELKRRHGSLDERIQILEKLVETNRAKFKREDERLSVGRTTTFQLTTYEEDLAESEIQLLKLKIERRKLEAQARLFLAENAAEAL